MAFISLLEVKSVFKVRKFLNLSKSSSDLSLLEATLEK